jgi:hypothetical protein
MGRNNSFVGAAEMVLRDGRARSASEIAEEAISRGLLTTSGKTPVATMRARLYVCTKRSDSRIVRATKEGPQRAKRSSVTWTLRDSAGDRR